MRQFRSSGFTVSEIVVSMSLIAVLGTLLLPMMSNVTGKQKLLNITKGAASELSSAYADFLTNESPSSNTTSQDIISYLNAVKIIIDGSDSTQIDYVPTAVSGSIPSNDADVNNSLFSSTLRKIPGSDGSRGGYTYSSVETVCDSVRPCALLQNGAILQYTANARFGTYWTPQPGGGWVNSGVPKRNVTALLFILDPDGRGIQRGVSLVLFYSGRITSMGFARDNPKEKDGSEPLLNAQFNRNYGAGSVGGYELLPRGLGFYVPAIGRTTDPSYITDWTDG